MMQGPCGSAHWGLCSLVCISHLPIIEPSIPSPGALRIRWDERWCGWSSRHRCPQRLQLC